MGDHGGGPTKQQIEWIMEHADDSKDVKMIFSHPRAFFDAVAEDMEKFPVVKAELQHHPVGCYSVLRSIKTGMVKAESRLVQAEAAAELFPDHTSSEDRETLDAAWDDVLFNQFHDILGGTSLEKESMRAHAELCAAESKADQVITSVSRRAFRCQARPGEHRIVALNLSDEPYEGAVEHEPWLQWRNTDLSLFDEQDNPIPFQEVEADVITSGLRRLVFRLSIPARGKRILKLSETPQAPKTGNSSPVKPELHELSGKDFKMVPGRDTICINGWKLSFEVIDDPTDTWSHAADRFDGKTEGSFSWPETMDVVESGPIRRTVRLKSTFDNSRIWARLMITGDEPILRMRLSVVWAQVRQLLRLRLEAPEAISERSDLVSGGFLERPTDGAEFPLNGGITAGTGSGRTAVISPDIFSGSVTPRTINLTLLRSPHMAHHDPAPADMRPDQPVTDQGSHTFDLAVWPHCSAELNQLERMVNEMKMPPVIWDLTG